MGWIVGAPLYCLAVPLTLPIPSAQIPAAAPLKGPGPASSPSLPHQAPLGDSPHLPSPHPARPPSRPPSRPHSRPPSQPQTLSRPPSEPTLHPCPPHQAPAPLPSIFVIQNQLAAPPPAGPPAPAASGPPQPPLRPPSQPPEGPLPPAPHLPAASTASSATAAATSETPTRLPAPTPPDFQLQFPAGQGSHKSPTPPPTLHLVPEPTVAPPPPPRSFQMVTPQFPALPQSKALLERFQQVNTAGTALCPPGSPPCPPLNHLFYPPHQVPPGIILQNKTGGPPATPQTPASLGPLTSPPASVLVSGQAPSGTPAAPSHPPAPSPMATAGREDTGETEPRSEGRQRWGVGTLSEGEGRGPSPELGCHDNHPRCASPSNQATLCFLPRVKLFPAVSQP